MNVKNVSLYDCLSLVTRCDSIIRSLDGLCRKKCLSHSFFCTETAKTDLDSTIKVQVQCAYFYAMQNENFIRKQTTSTAQPTLSIIYF